MFSQEILGMITKYDEFFTRISEEKALRLEDCHKKKNGLSIEYDQDGNCFFLKK
jgi:hypothetical protein